MLAVPAWVWRYPPVLRAAIVGLAVGVVTGLLAFLGSNSVLAGVAALVVISLLQGTLIARRMAKAWPAATTRSGAERVAVARAARRGQNVADVRIAQGVVDYSRGLRDAHERYHLYRWVIGLLGIAALGVAVLDTLTAPLGEAVVSWLYFAFFPVEAVWWPRWQRQVLANAERAERSARRVLADRVGEQ